MCAPRSEGPLVREEDEENGLGLPPVAPFVYLGQLRCPVSRDLLRQGVVTLLSVLYHFNDI